MSTPKLLDNEKQQASLVYGMIANLHQINDYLTGPQATDSKLKDTDQGSPSGFIPQMKFHQDQVFENLGTLQALIDNCMGILGINLREEMSLDKPFHARQGKLTAPRTMPKAQPLSDGPEEEDEFARDLDQKLETEFRG